MIRFTTALILLLVVFTAHVSTAQISTAQAATPQASPGSTVTRQLSVNGLFDVSYKSQLESIPLNEIHQWILSVSTPDGEPVTGATITVNGGMPMHNHGLPTAPRITKELEAGEYLLNGIKFQMPGHWTVEFQITAGDSSDKVTFNLML